MMAMGLKTWFVSILRFFDCAGVTSQASVSR